MERLVGSRRLALQSAELAALVSPYARVLVDLGTGDGRYVDYIARTHPDTFALGIDACREQLVARSRRAPANALYLIANALELPPELDGLATHLTINFPWGSLLAGLVSGDTALYQRLAAIARPGALLEVRLNAGATAEAGIDLDDGAVYIRRLLRTAGFEVRPPSPMSAGDLRAYPSTWAHRLAFGRDPHGLCLHGVRVRGGIYSGTDGSDGRDDSLSAVRSAPPPAQLAQHRFLHAALSREDV
jgi:16S rRNA (adenine(1408)-N(1))-methyltransferase